MRRSVGKLILASLLFAALLVVPKFGYAGGGSCSDAQAACYYEAGETLSLLSVAFATVATAVSTTVSPGTKIGARFSGLCRNCVRKRNWEWRCSAVKLLSLIGDCEHWGCSKTGWQSGQRSEDLGRHCVDSAQEPFARCRLQ